MIKEQQLFDQLRKADAAGDVEYARKVKAKIEQQRTEWSKANNFTDNRIVDKYGIEEAERQQREVYGGNTNAAEGMGAKDTFFTAAGRGIMDAAQGGKQLWKLATDPNKTIDLDNATISSPSADAYTEKVNKELEYYQDLQEQSPALSTVGRIVGNVAATPVPAARSLNTGKVVAGNVMASGLQFAPESGDRVNNMLVGGVAGAAGNKLLSNPLRKMGTKGNSMVDNVDEVMKAADKAGIDVRFDDINKSSAARVIGQQIDQVPIIGGGKSRQIQNEQAKAAAQAITKKYTPSTEIDDLSAAVSKNARDTLQSFKEQASEKFTKAYEPLNQAGNIDAAPIRNAATKVIKKELEKGSMADSGVVKQLQRIVDAPDGNFEMWADFNSDLNGIIRAAKKGDNTLVGDTAIGKLQTMSNAFESALDETAEKIGGQGGSEWRNARSYYKANVVPFKKGALKNALKDGDEEKMLDVLIGKGSGAGADSSEKAKQLYGGLDDNGKGLVRFGMVKRAMDEATDETGVFSPAKYASMLERYNRRAGVIFSKEQKAELDGLQSLMRHIQSAGDYAANIKTGQKAIPTLYGMAAASGAAANAPATAAAGFGVWAAKKMLTTKKGRSMLTYMAKLPEKSKNFTTLMGDAMAYLNRAYSLNQAQPEASDQEQEVQQ